MLMFREINDGSEVEYRVIAPAGDHLGAMMDFTTEQKVPCDLLLHDSAHETPILIARAGIDAVAAAAINRPVTKFFLQPQRQKGVNVTAAEAVRCVAGGRLQQGKQRLVWSAFWFLCYPAPSPASAAAFTKSLMSDWRMWGEHPIETMAAGCHLQPMNPLLLIVILLLLFGGGGFYFGGPAIGGGGLGLILVICLLIYVMGGFRSKS
jgi:hypothetical protein